MTMNAPEPPRETESAILDRLRADLASRARREGLVDAITTRVESSIGSLLLVATDDGLLRVAFDSEGHREVLAVLAELVGPRILRDDVGMARYAAAVTARVEGVTDTEDLSLDLRQCSGFRREVLEHLRTIPAGQTSSYAEVARAVGRPGAVRAVGTACATNPLPLVIPCHRVVRSDGSVGGYLGGAEVKRRLLAAERSAA